MLYKIIKIDIITLIIKDVEENSNIIQYYREFTGGGSKYGVLCEDGLGVVLPNI